MYTHVRAIQIYILSPFYDCTTKIWTMARLALIWANKSVLYDFFFCESNQFLRNFPVFQLNCMCFLSGKSDNQINAERSKVKKYIMVTREKWLL